MRATYLCGVSPEPNELNEPSSILSSFGLVRTEPSRTPCPSLEISARYNSVRAESYRAELTRLALPSLRTEQKDNINRTIELYRETIPLSPQVQSVATTHNMLSQALALRHGRTGSLNDLDDAVKASDAALALTMSDDPQRPCCLLNLAVPTLAHYKQTGRMEDLNRAISASKDALDSMPGGDPTRALCLNIGGTCYSLRFELTYSMGRLDISDYILPASHQRPS